MKNTQKCREAEENSFDGISLEAKFESLNLWLNNDGNNAETIIKAFKLGLNEGRKKVPEPAKVNGDDSKRLDWLEENSTYVGGGNGGTFTFKTPADTECFRAAIDAAINKSQ